MFMNGAIRVVCLLCREVMERHFATNIQKWIGDGQNDFEITDSQIIAMSIDSARNVTRATDDFIKNLSKEEELLDDYNAVQSETDENGDTHFDDDPVKVIEDEEEESCLEDEEVSDDDSYESAAAVRIHCVVHKLQLAINDFLWKIKGNSCLITIAQKLAAKLRNSIVRSIITDAKHNQAILDQKTRWNSTFFMIFRLLSLQNFCEEKAPLFKGLRISSKRWASLQEMHDVLKPVADLTSRLQHEQLDVTQFVAFWKLAMFRLEVQGSAKAAELRKCIELREKPIFSNRLIQTAIYLDKIFSFTLKPEEVVIAKEFIMQIWKKRKCISGQTYLKNLAQNSGQQLQSLAVRKNPTIIEAEISEFDSFPCLSAETRIMEFWKNQKHFPVLKEIALDIISAPVTEVSVERLFSRLNFILNPHRAALNAGLLEDILFLRMNRTFEKSK